MELSVQYELDGWQLFAAELGRGEDDEAGLAALRQDTATRMRRDLDLSQLAAHPTVAALRRLFRLAGTDPTRYRPSSEALLRRLLKGGELPAIDPFVDVNNCLSARLAVPCCVMAEGTFDGPFVLRSGAPGEAYESLRGPFKLEGRPLLVDALGPCDSPITGSQRVKVSDDTERCTLVAYLPRDVVGLERARQGLEGIVGGTSAVVVVS